MFIIFNLNSQFQLWILVVYIYVYYSNRNSSQKLKNCLLKILYNFWSILTLFLSLFTLFCHHLFLLVDQFLLFHEMAKYADFVISVLDKIESINSPRPQLQQVVVEALFADADHSGSVLERVPLQLHFVILVFVWHYYAIVQLTPYHYFFDYFFNSTLLGSNDFFRCLF